MSSLFEVGLSGLRAAQISITTTGHNIANVDTPGYTRQVTEQSAETSQFSGAGFIGKGVRTDAVKRVYDEFLVAQLRDAGTREAGSAVLSQQLGRLSGLLGDESTGVNPVLANFFAAANDVAQHPNDLTARNALLAGANSFAVRLQDIDGELQRLRGDTNMAIDRAVTEINTITKQIAEINDQVALQANTGQTPNDLLDLRDRMIGDLAKNVRLTTTTMPDGTVNVFLGSGQALVVGNESYNLAAVNDPKFATDRTLSLQTQSGTVYLTPSQIGGGELVGQFAFRDGALTDAENELGRIAQTFSYTVNQQHRLGTDRNGNLGADLFSVGVPQAYSDTRNTGNGVITATITDGTQLAGSDYEVSWDGANYTVRRTSDGNTQTFASLPQTLDGVQLSIAGSPNAGDSFLVLPTRFAAQDMRVLIGDPNRIAASTPVRSSASLSNLGDATISAPSVVGPTPNPNLQQPVTITFTSATAFNVSGTGTGNPAGVAYTAGGTISYNGWTLKIDGTPKPGDTFTIGANTGGTGDNGNAQALASLQTRQIVQGETLAGAYGSLVADVGNEAAAAQVTHLAHARMQTNAFDAHQELSGVNLDEEAANLLRYQAAYQAAAKFTSIVQSLFDEFLQRLG